MEPLIKYFEQETIDSGLEESKLQQNPICITNDMQLLNKTFEELSKYIE